MPEVTITIGGRDFTVACQEGEEPYLSAAASLLDTEATALAAQIGRLPEARMLLMSGLMLADKAAGIEDQLRAAEEKLARAEKEAAAVKKELEALKSAPPPEPEKVEVPVIPESVRESMAEIAARAEALADSVEEKVKAGEDA